MAMNSPKDSNAAAEAEHIRRLEVIRANPYVLELAPETFVSSHRIVVDGPIDGAFRSRIRALGYESLTAVAPVVSGGTADGYKQGGMSPERADAFELLRSELGIEFFEGTAGSASGALKDLQGSGVRAGYVPLLTLAPTDMGPAGPPTIAAIAPSTIRSTKGGHPVTIAVLDTGLPKHLMDWHTGNALLIDIHNVDVTEPLYVNAFPDLDEPAAPGHGVFVSAVAARHTPRVVEIDSYRMSEFISSTAVAGDPAIPTGTLVGTAEVAADLIRAAKRTNPKHYLVYNLSFGGYYSTAIDVDFLLSTLKHVLKLRPGTVFCAAAGNKASFEAGPGYNDGTIPIYPAAYSLDPVIGKNVISVGAIGASSNEAADFSGRGDWVKAWANGVGIVGEYVAGDWTSSVNPVAHFLPSNPVACWSGTSFATPFVAAAIARFSSANSQTPFDAWASMVPTLPVGVTWSAGGVVHNEQGCIVT